MGSMSLWHWLIVLVIVVLLFGTKKLTNIGGDVAAAIKNFRKGLQDDDDKTPPSQLKADPATADPMQTDPAAKATADSKRENTPQD
jgi:sec-independent protein translocase protein TatA